TDSCSRRTRARSALRRSARPPGPLPPRPPSTRRTRPTRLETVRGLRRQSDVMSPDRASLAVARSHLRARLLGRTAPALLALSADPGRHPAVRRQGFAALREAGGCHAELHPARGPHRRHAALVADRRLRLVPLTRARSG